ncbi:D-xylose ABC transporter ATP-binding protein [Christensenella minuta]|jgi:ABC-type sugar transport system ATPase subunit|uniref:Putative sugar ABC transporter, ATP binding protein n=2 Tax=Christensenella minuta TaxID=626937 RepID=A0A136Q8W1_9FIRM|nr:sugar ABC transporter ATP-binding protein [Christensenella minuta]AYH41409.1 sugar ABC transporter ATP-binding protein [Christensenella minuta]KXK67115.1 putative sugar ABC transporter, ATP binding protein [Christensenella minuta]OAQ40986.1 D-xylose ABC transporter ATP-binding protein [Christensenella minuta]
MMETILEMKKITKIFPGVRALDEVDFDLRKGEIHALIGENGAGKSTLMKALLGMYEIDGGEIWFKGEKVNFKGPNDALHAGISMIHQEISLVQTMSAAENIWMGRTGRFTKMGIIDHKRLMRETRELCARLGIQIDPAAVVETLSVANMQLVELVRAVSYNADVIVMDEPTSALTDAEIELLYKIVRDLAVKGTSIIFISHKLEEIFEICDRVTIMRDGQYIDCRDTTDIGHDELIKLIAGREINNIYTKDRFEKGDVALEVKNLSSTGTFRNVSFAVRKGEILGFCGLMGAGRSEIMRAVFGIDPYDSGEVLIRGKKAAIKSPQDAIKNGIGMVTEDRLRQGAIHSLDIKTNMSLPFLPQLSKMGFVYNAKEKEQCERMAQKMSVNMVSFANNIGSLSGGNQQKVIIGRWLLMDPDILILDEPTRGIDVGAKSEIYKIMNDLAKQGMAIIMVSSEMPEILGMSDRIAVVREGEIVCVMENEGLEQQTLLAHAFGVANKMS